METTVLRQIYRHGKLAYAEKLNSYGDIIESGTFDGISLQGCGCKYDIKTRMWIKSPHFHAGSVYGIGCIIDSNDAVVFYGIMNKDSIVQELLVFHPFLKEELEKYKVSGRDDIIEKNVIQMLNSS